MEFGGTSGNMLTHDGKWGYVSGTLGPCPAVWRVM